MKYGLLAIDIDGTLIGPDQRVPAETLDAIAAAEQAGLLICLATGRTIAESMPIWKQLPLRLPCQPMVVVGGAMVCEPHTGRTLYHRTIPRELAWEFGDALAGEGYSALALVDVWRHGVDYYLGENHDGEAMERLWFSKMSVNVRRATALRDHGDMPDPLRINAVMQGGVPGLADRLAERFKGRLTIHAILAPNYGVTVVEAFSPQASKYNAVVYVAQAHKIGTGRIAAIGDDINDLPMVRGVGLGATFPHAPQSVRDAAKHIASGGLAKFIRELVAGTFD